MLARSLPCEWRAIYYLQFARRFLDATGHLPKWDDVFREVKVGSWLTTKRFEAKRGKLSGERIQLIEDALGADAMVPVIDFERSLAEVAEHQRCHGRLPTSRTDTPLLYTWLAGRRQAANNGSLLEAHAHRLDTVLGVEWRPKFKTHMVRHPHYFYPWQPAEKCSPLWHCVRMCSCVVLHEQIVV